MPLPARAALQTASAAELLALYASIVDELLDRRIARSSNNPVADYAEYLVAQAFGLTLAANAVRGYDAIDEAAGTRYEVKGRRLQTRNHGRQLSFFRGFNDVERPFDVLVAILFEPDFHVRRAARMAYQVVHAHAGRSNHVNGWRLTLSDTVWDIPGVEDVTTAIREAATQSVRAATAG